MFESAFKLFSPPAHTEGLRQLRGSLMSFRGSSGLASGTAWLTSQREAKHTDPATQEMANAEEDDEDDEEDLQNARVEANE